MLQKGCHVDLHPRAFPVGAAVSTLLGPVQLIVWRTGEDRYWLMPRSSFADYLAGWLDVLREDLADLLERLAPVARRLGCETELADVFASVLGLPTVGAEDNFFALGGDSIMSIQLSSLLRSAGFDIRPRDIFEHKTVRSMAALVAAPEQTTLPEFPQGEVLTHDAIDLVTASIEGTVGTMRSVHDEVDEADPTSADILHGIIEKLEQQAWFISAETRTPKER